MQLQPHDLHICPCLHGTSCVFQPNADQELDGSDNKIRHGEDNPSQTTGRRLQGCGRKMHTTGSIDCFIIFKFAATSFMNTYFEQVIERDLAGQDAFYSTYLAHAGYGRGASGLKNAEFSVCTFRFLVYTDFRI